MRSYLFSFFVFGFLWLGCCGFYVRDSVGAAIDIYVCGTDRGVKGREIEDNDLWR